MRGLKKEDVHKGQVMCKPGTVTPHKKFEAHMYVLSKVLHQLVAIFRSKLVKDEGGRHTPFVNGYRPQLFIRTGNITCTIILPDGKVRVAYD